jgi:uncharacterized protein YbaR (Trm112 family)/2-polyprenyl-3-methyl-5-hydroxy-6-metoxy-1,4-benzoquinol methylase
MRQSLVPLLACPSCRGALICSSSDGTVASGLLRCTCGRWFPIDHGIPELLPDHLRDWDKDAARLAMLATALPDEEQQILRAFRPTQPLDDPGAHYKHAEIGIQSKVDEPLFFVPGETSPFASWDPHFSLYLIKLFGVSAPLLNLQKGELVIDSGCGYAWTTEWLYRSGFDPIGVDICRTYLEVAERRMGSSQPHLVIADVEHLPFQPGIARAVLAYESFHHIPNRPEALRAFERVLSDDGTVILAEPGAAHEHAQVAIDAMAKYGILEKGMELADVKAYATGTTFSVEQLFLVRFGTSKLGELVDAAFVNMHSVVEGNLFRLVKGHRATAPVETVTTQADPAPPPLGLVGRFKRRLKATS